jgi:hypothetical protein
MKNKWLLIIISILLVFAFFISIDWISNLFFDKKIDGIYPRFELLKLFLQGAGGLAIIIGIFISIKTLSLNEKNVEQGIQTLKLNYENLKVERFKLAIENLASGSSEIRIASFYTLIGIAYNEQSERENIFHILSSYLRNKTKKEFLESDEIQILLNLMFDKNKTPFSELKIDFENVHFKKLLLMDFVLKDISFHEALLDHLYFDRSNLNGSFFTKAKVQNVSFEHCDLGYAYMNGSEFTNVSFCYTTLKGARFNDSILTNCNFSGAVGIAVDSFRGVLVLNNCFGIEPGIIQKLQEENPTLKVL